MRVKYENENVLYLNDKIKKINSADLKFLLKKSESTKNKSIRLCIHKNKQSILHQMLIIHPKNFIVPPQYHLKEEIIKVVSGKAKLNYFRNNGKIEKSFLLNKDNFFHLIAPKKIHNLEIISKKFIFLEVSLGPFKKNNTLYPDWLNK